MDIEQIYRELDELGEVTANAAQTSEPLLYFEARDKYRKAIISAELSSGEKGPHFLKLADNDITFFHREDNKVKYKYAASVIDEVAREYYEVLLEAAKIPDIKKELNIVSKNLSGHTHIAGGSMSYDVKKTALILKPTISELYSKTEEHYWEALQIDIREEMREKKKRKPDEFIHTS